ncbi:putative uncharacterized protein DDB_G0282133 [Eurosta solidaginis]|uniref:putative uncharacterized protein DDB_G0282133 n=1 Tax=Eurosta solidaginis TaxID=178769 RepID=UPI0035315CFC
MSVIIRLQNLPWSANALDIRQFFKGLSIPDGGVHIVGGEMGDAFIAFSTDEDARQAMMHDRKKINEVQVRLLLSSRAEMQKVIETARQQSLLALKNAGALGALKAAAVTATPTPPQNSTPPQPPVITANSLHNILSTSAAPSFLAYQKQAGITLIEPPIATPPAESSNTITESTTTSSSYRGHTEKSSRDRRRSSSRDRRRSRSRERNDRNDRTSSRRGRRDRSRSRSRERDWKSRRSNRRSRSRERSHERVNRDPRSIDRNSDRNPDRNSERQRNTSSRSSNTSNRERDNKDMTSNNNNIRTSSTTTPKFMDINENSNSAKVASISSNWSIPPAMNAYQTNTIDATQQQGKSMSFPLAPTSANLMLNPFSMGGSAASNLPGLGAAPQLANSYTTSSGASNKSAAEMQASMAATSTLPSFQNYTTSLSSTNNYSINLFNTNSSALQNPYTAAVQQQQQQSPLLGATNSLESAAANSATASPQPTNQTTPSTNNNTMFPGLALMDTPAPLAAGAPNASTTVNQLPQEPIAFANTNPYAQMYPNLFAQAAAAAQSMVKPSGIQQNPKIRSGEQNDAQMSGMHRNNKNDQQFGESCCIKMSNMCNSTTYSDIRKFFVGQFIPHNGIKMVNDKHGIRIGVAYIQFSRISSVHKAMTRNNASLRGNIIQIEMVSVQEFDSAEDSYRPQSSRFERNYNERNTYQNDDNDNNSGGEEGDNNDSNYRRDYRDYDNKAEPYTVLYIEDIPSSAVEHDLMRMFSSYTIFDILLTPSRENRREFKGYVLFSRAEEAKAALEDRSTHMIGYRKVRVSPGSTEEMERVKEKLRLANEQLIKEEEALAEAERLKRDENIGGEDDMDVAEDDNDDDDVQNNEINDNDDGGEESNFNEANYNNNDNPGLQQMDEQLNEQHQPAHQYHNSADPRIAKIPSLFELPPIKSEDLLKRDDDILRSNPGPSDPRLRRQKRSRFEPLKPEDEDSINMNIGMDMGGNMNDGNNMMMGMNDGPMGGGNIGMNEGNSMGGSSMSMNDGPMGIRGGGMNVNDGPIGIGDGGMGMNDGSMGMRGGGGMGMNDGGPMNMNEGPGGMGMNNNMGMSMNNNNSNDNNNMNNMNMNFNNSIEHNFILMKNCDYNTRMNDVAELLQSAFLRLKHIEPLRGERNMPTGEFIVEFLDARDAETAIRRFNNHTFRQRKLRIRSIMPQEIADRIGKPFMNCLPGGGNDRNHFSNNNDGGGGGRYGNKSMDNNDNNSGRGGPMSSRSGSRNNMGAGAGSGSSRSERDRNDRDRSERDSGSSTMRKRGGRFNTSASSHDGHSDDDVQVIDDSSNDVTENRKNLSGSGVDDDENGGIPQKFTRPGCVVAMENVPYKAELADISKFFSGFDLTPDDIIRRFNDDGTPTGDARVAFASPSIARQAYNSRRRKQIFNRTIRLTLL